MKKLEPFAVRTKHLTDGQLSEMFLLAEKAGATLDEGNEDLCIQRGRTDVSVLDKLDFELAGVNFNFDTRMEDNFKDFIKGDEDHAFYLFASHEDACEYLNSIIESQNEGPTTPEIDFTNTKLYTKDKDLIRKYVKLCGAEDEVMHDALLEGAYFKGGACVLGFMRNSPVDNCSGKSESIAIVTPDQVETEYAKRFDFGEPNANKIQPHPEGVEYNRTDNTEILWSGGNCVYRKEGDRVEVLLSGVDVLPALEDVLSKLRSLSA